MKITAAILLLIAATASAIEWTDLRVKRQSPSLDPCDSASNYQMPRTKADAIFDGWVEVSGITSLNLSVYCRDNDGRVCLEYDSHGNIAAIQASLLYNDDPDLQTSLNYYQIKTIFNEKYWTSTVYFISPDTIAAGGRCKTNGLTGTGGVWLETKDGYMKIPRNLSYSDSAWSKQNCVPTIGTHYFYGLFTSSDCTAIYPWTLLTHDNQLIGVGLLGLGKATYRTRHYYDTFQLAAMNTLFSTNPYCFADWVKKFGLTSMHIYFTPESWKIQC